MKAPDALIKVDFSEWYWNNWIRLDWQKIQELHVFHGNCSGLGW